MYKDIRLLDFSMNGLEGGKPRVYNTFFPTVTTHIDNKWNLVEIFKLGVDTLNGKNTILKQASKQAS